MKIIQVSTYFPPAQGGVERQVEEISKKLSEIGHEITVLATDADHGGKPRIISKNSSNGFEVKRFKYLFGFGEFFRFAPGLCMELLNADYDIIHIHNAHDAHLLPAIIIKILRKKKLVLTGHNPFVVEGGKRRGHISFGVKFYEFVLKFFIKAIDKYIALLKSEKEYVAYQFAINAERISIIPNGIDNYFFEDGDGKKFQRNWNIDTSKYELIVGSLCRMNEVKGLQNLEDAVKNLPNVLFIFAGGDDGYLNKLKEIYSGYSNVIFTSRYLNREEGRDFYNLIDIFVLPSIYEPFGITLLEAMSQGKVILANETAGPLEIIKPEFGKIIKKVNDWTTMIEFYIENKKTLSDVVKFAKIEAEKYKWENVMSKIEEVYKSI